MTAYNQSSRSLEVWSRWRNEKRRLNHPKQSSTMLIEGRVKSGSIDPS